MKSIPDLSSFFYILNSIWDKIKSIGLQDLEIFPIIGLSAMLSLLLIFYLLRSKKDHS
jgi:LPXTG-motif cell wall-anchored protein